MNQESGEARKRKNKEMNKNVRKHKRKRERRSDIYKIVESGGKTERKKMAEQSRIRKQVEILVQ